jgi:predicted PurR-regulated permease PerM
VARAPTPAVEPPIGAEELAQTAPPPQPEPTFPPWRTLARWLLVALALYAVGWLLWSALPSLTPFIIGLVLAYLLLPVVNWLARRIPRWLAILTVYVGGIILVAISIAYIAPVVADQIGQLIENFPGLVDRVQARGQELLRQYQSSVPVSIKGPLEEGVRNGLRALQANITSYAQGVGVFIFDQALQVLNTITFLVGFLVIPIWLYYVLSDVGKGRSLIDRMLHPRLRSDFWNIWGIINKVLSDYIRGQLLLGLAVGLMVGVALIILELLGFQIGNYILLLALIAGMTELIPIIGPILGAIPGVLLGLFISPQAALAMAIVYIAVQQIENNLLVPRIIGESVGIHPAILTVVLIAMGQIFGLLGIILAAPLSAIARDLFLYVYWRVDGAAPDAARRAIRGSSAPEPAKG